MSNQPSSNRQPASAPARLADAIAHTATRIQRGDPGGLRNRLLDLVRQCLVTNQPAPLKQAAGQVAQAPDVAHCLEHSIAFASQNLIRSAEDGRQLRHALFAVPVSFSGLPAEPMALPAALPDVAPIRDELIRRGAPADGLIVSPWLHDPDVLGSLPPTAVLRLLHQLVPPAVHAADRLVEPQDVAWPRPTPLSAGQYHEIEKMLLGVCVQPVGTPAFFEMDPAGADTLDGQLADWLGAQVGLDGHILTPLALDGALAFVRHSRPGRQIMRNITFALLSRGIVPETTYARLSADVGFPDNFENWLDEHSVMGNTTVEIPLREVPFELTGLTVQILPKDAGENALPIHEESLSIPPGLNPDAVLDGVAMALLSIGIAPPLDGPLH